jgi:hypothetical protein
VCCMIYFTACLNLMILASRTTFILLVQYSYTAQRCVAVYVQANALLGIGRSDAVFSSIVQQQQQQQTNSAETETETAVPSGSISTNPLPAATTATTAATAISATDRPLTYREEMQNGVAAIARQRIQGLQGGVVSLFSAVVGQRTASAASAAANTPLIDQASSTGGATSAATSSLSSSAHGTTTAATDRDSSSGASGSSSGAAASSSGNAMTAETVTALSKKLTHAEMRGIIGLTDRLKRMSQTATQSQVIIINVMYD